VRAAPPAARERFDVREWSDTSLPKHLRLEPSDRDTLDQLAEESEGSQRLTIDELVSGIRIRSSSWVGVVRFAQFELRVVPKLARDSLGVLKMLAFAGGISRAQFLKTRRTLAGDREASLLDLVCWILANHSNRLIDGGLLQSYVPKSDSLPALRGRLDLVRQAVRRYGQVAPLECDYEEFDTDIIENRILAAALNSARRVASDAYVQSQVSLSQSVLTEATDLSGFQLSVAERQLEYDRRNAHYREAHYWALVLLRGLGVEDLFESGGGTSFVFLFDMNAIFEDFVSRLVEDAFASTDIRVHRQYRDSAVVINEATNRSYAAIRPDLLLEEQSDPRRRVPVDAKYKLYDERKLDPSDVYQTFFYGHTYGRPGQPVFAAILYPSDRSSEGTLLRVATPEGGTPAHVRAIAVNLPALLADDAPATSAAFASHLRQTLLG
jgi:5-methylcytosine-specific restriction enzyme subunit McrC